MYTKMNPNGSRGHLRPNFGGRSSPFVVAALCVGLGILAVSYYNLSTQFTALEVQLSGTLQRQDSIEKGEQLIHNQLQLKEEEYAKAKVTLEKKEQELADLANQIASKDEQLNTIAEQLKSLQNDISQKTKDVAAVNQDKLSAQQEKTACDENLRKVQSQLAKQESDNKDTQVKLNTYLNHVNNSRTDAISEKEAIKSVNGDEIEDTADKAILPEKDQLQPPKANVGMELTNANGVNTAQNDAVLPNDRLKVSEDNIDQEDNTADVN